MGRVSLAKELARGMGRGKVAKRLLVFLLSNWFSHVSFAFNIRCFSNVAVIAQEWKFCCMWFRIKKNSPNSIAEVNSSFDHPP